MPSLIQADRKYSALAVVAIATRLALRDPGKQLNIEQAKSSGIEKNGSKRNSGSRTFQVQRRGWRPRNRKQATHTQPHRTMMLKYWEALREAVCLEFCSPPCFKSPLRELRQHPPQEGTGIAKGTIAMQIIVTRKFLPFTWMITMTRILVMSKLQKNPIQKAREEGLRQQRGRGSATPAISAKRKSVRSANKNQSQLQPP